MYHDDVFMKLAMASVVVAVVITLSVDGGWVVWFPVLLALYVVHGIWRTLGP